MGGLVDFLNTERERLWMVRERGLEKNIRIQKNSFTNHRGWVFIMFRSMFTLFFCSFIANLDNLKERKEKRGPRKGKSMFR